MISVYENGRAQRVISKKDGPFVRILSSAVEPIDSSRIDISVVAVGSLNRVFISSIVASRWDG